MLILVRDSLYAVTGLPEYIGYLFAFLLGAAIGSFLNVVIYRVPNEESIVFPGSACPKCGTAIRAYDNIPILSWLFLRGRCRACKDPISPRYPAVELLTALVFVLVYWEIGFVPFLPVAFVFVSAMIALIFIDAEHMILPNVITYPLLVMGFLVRVVFAIFLFNSVFPDVGTWPFLTYISGLPLWAIWVVGGLAGAIIGGGSLWLVGEAWKRLRGVEAMGLGDVKMMAGVGALLGWRLTLLSIFLGAFSGALIGSVLLMRQKDRDFQMQIPFGIFLGLGSIVSLLFGEQMIDWYISMFLNQ